MFLTTRFHWLGLCSFRIPLGVMVTIQISRFLMTLNASLNFVIYCFMSPLFRSILMLEISRIKNSICAFIGKGQYNDEGGNSNPCGLRGLIRNTGVITQTTDHVELSNIVTTTTTMSSSCRPQQNTESVQLWNLTNQKVNLYFFLEKVIPMARVLIQILEDLVVLWETLESSHRRLMWNYQIS